MHAPSILTLAFIKSGGFAAADKPEVKLYKIAGEYQLADIFTKGLPRVTSQFHCRNIMGE